MLFRSRSRLSRLGVLVCSVLALQYLSGASAGAEPSWSIGTTASYGASERGLYAYAPSVVGVGDSTYYFTCHNSVRGVIRDSIWLAQSVGGRVVREQAVLSPSATGWDSHHVCDPSVVAGRFGFGGRTYGFAMFYLGTPADNTDNQIGVAFADDLAGPWIRSPEPVVGIPASAASTWGIGQPSAVSLDPSTGSVELFYTDGTSGTAAYRRHLVLGATGWAVGDPVRLSTAGLHGDVLHDFDMAYDRLRSRFYVAREAGAAPASAPRNISTDVEVDSMAAADLWAGTGAWRVEGRITPALTGFPRNHNPGILRTVDGALPAGQSIDVVVSRSLAGSFPAVLTSYDLWTVRGRRV